MCARERRNWNALCWSEERERKMLGGSGSCCRDDVILRQRLALDFYVKLRKWQNERRAWHDICGIDAWTNEIMVLCVCVLLFMKCNFLIMNGIKRRTYVVLYMSKILFVTQLSKIIIILFCHS